MTGSRPVSRLDDVEALRAGDQHQMLGNVASAGEQVREALATCDAAGLAEVAAAGRPRAVVVAGMGGSGIAGHVLQAAAGTGCPIPVERVRGWGLPAWVGDDDLVVAVSSSGRTAETASCLAEALDRKARIVVVAAEGSPLVQTAQAHDLPWVAVPDGRPPRANLWALSVPLLVTGHALGIVHAPSDELAAVADLLDGIAARCAPAVPADANPAKQLAAELTGTLPMIWGSTDLAGIAAYRMLCQLAENAKTASVNGVLPEALHNQVVVLDGPSAAAGAAQPLRLVLLRDSVESVRQERGARAAHELVAARGVAVSTITAEGRHPLQRMASLVAVGDFASVYLGLLLGVDPTSIAPIDELKAALAAQSVVAAPRSPSGGP
jgi:glucose/mannose-6-phosphate isomerase